MVVAVEQTQLSGWHGYRLSAGETSVGVARQSPSAAEGLRK